MTSHTITKETTVRSKIIASAPPGEQPRLVIKKAMVEVDAVCEKVGLRKGWTDIFVDPPVYQEGRRWLVLVIFVYRTTDLVEV